MKRSHITPAILHDLLICDYEAGTLTWKTRPVGMFAETGHGGQAGVAARWNGKHAGQPALSAIEVVNGYNHGKVFGVSLKAHRVVFAMFHGFWPKGQIDHIDGVRTNNCIRNLRDVTGHQNCKNTKLRKDSTTGVAGVYPKPDGRGFLAQIGGAKSRVYLGAFVNIEAAIAARAAAEIKHGYHPNHGRVPS